MVTVEVKQKSPFRGQWVFILSVDYILLNWNYLIKELQEWQSLGMAIEQAQTA